MSPIVEIAFGTAPLATTPVWTDVTRYVHTDAEITIDRGRSDELNTIQPGTCTLTLDNTDARFTPTNPASPYYPNIKKGRRLRVRVVHVESNYAQNPSFEGPSIHAWDGTGAAIGSTTTRAHHGTRSGVITWRAVAGENVATTLYGLEVDQVYTASAWVWVPAGGVPVQLGVAGRGTGAASSVTGAWEQITHTWVATDTVHVLRFTPLGAPAVDQLCWVDEIMAGDGPAPVPYSPTGAYISERYDGYVNRWPVTWPGGGRVATTTITCTDIFKRLGQSELRSMLEEEVLRHGPAAYYPLAESGSETTSAGDAAARGAGPLGQVQAGSGGTLALGQGTGPGADGLSAPAFTPADAGNGLYLTADLGTAYEADSSRQVITAEAWFNTLDTGRVILALRSFDAVFRLVMRLQAGTGKLQIDSTYAGSSIVTVVETGNLADGATHHVAYNEYDRSVHVDGVDRDAGFVQTMYRIRYLDVGGTAGAGMWAGSISHVTVALGWVTNAAFIRDRHTAGRTGFAGDDADTRVERIAKYAGLPFTYVQSSGTLFGPIASQGAGRKSPLALMQEVADTESAVLVAGRAGGLQLQARDVRYQPTPLVTLDAADLDGPPAYADDDQYLANEVRATRPGGAVQTFTAPASQADYGRYVATLSLLKTTDAGVHDAAQWHLWRYRDPAPRLRSLPVEAYTLDTATYRALLAVDVSSALAVTGLPDQAPAAAATVTAEGYTETIGRLRHRFDFHTSPADVDQGWILDDPTWSILDSTTVLTY